MATASEYRNEVRPNWCPGCGHYGVHAAILDAVAQKAIPKENLAIVSGIGCSSRIGGYVYAYGSHTTHGRSLPYAQGLKLANENLEVICCSGDGDAYAIGMGHTMHAMKRNVNLTYIVMDNHVYGLTKGQTSPRSDVGFVTKTSPFGSFESPLPICETAIAAGATFVAQEYSVNREKLANLIVLAMEHEGFSFINVFSPCVTYNKQNGYEYFKNALTDLGRIPEYDPTNRLQVMQTLMEYDGLVTGLIYKQEKASFDAMIKEVYKQKAESPLVHRVEKPDLDVFDKLCQDFM